MTGRSTLSPANCADQPTHHDLLRPGRKCPPPWRRSRSCEAQWLLGHHTRQRTPGLERKRDRAVIVILRPDRHPRSCCSYNFMLPVDSYWHITTARSLACDLYLGAWDMIPSTRAYGVKRTRKCKEQLLGIKCTNYVSNIGITISLRSIPSEGVDGKAYALFTPSMLLPLTSLRAV